MSRPFSLRRVSAGLLLATSPAVAADLPGLAPGQRYAPGAVATQGQSYVVSSNTGLNVNSLLGASAFYTGTFDGGRSTVANIEGGNIWNGFEALAHVQTYIPNPGSISPSASPTLASFDGHATAVGNALGGRVTATPNERQRGIAPGATLWSGAVATSFTSSVTFNSTFATQVTPYRNAMIAGIGGQFADVVNSSWGIAGDPAGVAAGPMAVDAMIRASGATRPAAAVVFAAGNGTLAQVSGFAAGYNTISVGALTSDAGTNPYTLATTFTSRGRSDTFVPAAATGGAGSTQTNTRVRVDIAAPGDSLLLATTFAPGSPGAPTSYSPTPLPLGGSGTSFAAPIVAGGLALMADAAKANGLTAGPDARVLKSVLQTTAFKPTAWSNGQTTTNGVVRTTQALDVATGAGRMDLAAAMPYFGTGAGITRDVPGTAAGAVGNVQDNGWDFGQLDRGTTNEYRITPPLSGDSKMTVTLNWFANRGFNSTTLDPASLTENTLANLSLEVWALDGNDVFRNIVAESNTQFNTTEHLSFTLPRTDRYGIRVRYLGDNWDFAAGSTEQYAVSWSYAPVPEPTGLLAAAAVGLLGVRRFRRG